MKALAGVGLKRRGIFVAAAWNRYAVIVGHLAAVETSGRPDSSLCDMNHADDHRRLPRPLVRGAGRNRSCRRACRSSAGQCAGVALGDRVRGDQPEGAAASQQVERPAEEVGDQVGVAVRLLDGSS